MVWPGSNSNNNNNNSNSTPAKKAMVFALFRRNHNYVVQHAKLKEDKIALVQQRSKESTDSGNGGRSHHESNFIIQPDIFEDIVNEGRDEEWAAEFEKKKMNQASGTRDTTLNSNNNTSSSCHTRGSACSSSSRRNDSAVALLPPAATSPKAANATVSFSATSKMTASSLIDNKDALIESLKLKCRALRDKVLQYGDVDNYSESETAMALEREQYRLKKELKVVKSQLKFTNTALEDAVEKLQNQSLEKAALAETIDNQSDQIHDFRLQTELLEKEVRELKRLLEKRSISSRSVDENSDSDASASQETEVDIVLSSSSSSTGESASAESNGRHTAGKNVQKTKSNPFDDDKSTTSSTYRNPFSDDLSSPSQSRSQRRNPFGSSNNNENVNTDNHHDRHAAAEEAMQKQLADLQAKYAEKVAVQLSTIATLQEENDIKTIQLKNLQDQLEKQQQQQQHENSSSQHKRAFTNWMRKDGNSGHAVRTMEV